MATLRVENVPDELRERLERLARKRDTSLDDVILSMLERRLERIDFNEYIDEKLARSRAE